MGRSSLIIASLLLALSACGQPRGKALSFDEIRSEIQGKTAAEALEVLGKPDSRQKMLFLSERWVWWNYTYLDGENYAPEIRGKKVHLEIIFDRIDSTHEKSEPSPAKLRATDPLQITYTLVKESPKGEDHDGPGI